MVEREPSNLLFRLREDLLLLLVLLCCVCLFSIPSVAVIVSALSLWPYRFLAHPVGIWNAMGLCGVWPRVCIVLV